MQVRELNSNRSFIAAFAVVALSGVLFLSANVFVVGGDRAITGLNQHVTPPLALLAALLAVWVWSRSKADPVSGRVWADIATGLVLWAVAEVVSWVYAVIVHQDPYPSWADLFFLVGLVPLLAGLGTRYRSLRAGTPRRHRAIAAALAGVLGTITFLLVIVPIIAGFDPSRLLESILDVFYPATDLALLVLAILVFSIYEGSFGVPWQILAIGMAFMATGDLLFSYATWNEVYYPGGHVNLISALSDFSYNYSYLVLALGIYSAGSIPEARPLVARPELPKIPAPSLPNANILVFTDGANTIISVSDNFSSLFQTDHREYLVDTPLGQALGLSEAIASSLLKHLTTRGYVINQPVRVVDAGGNSHAVALTAIAVRDGAGTFKGAQVLLRTHLNEENPDRDLSWESQRLVEYILGETGLQEEEGREQIKAYFMAHIRLFFSLAEQIGGQRVADRIETLLNEAAQQRRWNVSFQRESVVVGESYGSMNLGEVLATLLGVGRNYLASVSNREMVDREIEALNQRLDGKLLRAAEHYRLRNA